MTIVSSSTSSSISNNNDNDNNNNNDDARFTSNHVPPRTRGDISDNS